MGHITDDVMHDDIISDVTDDIIIDITDDVINQVKQIWHTRYPKKKKLRKKIIFENNCRLYTKTE